VSKYAGFFASCALAVQTPVAQVMIATNIRNPIFFIEYAPIHEQPNVIAICKAMSTRAKNPLPTLSIALLTI
jgi:hypothetical protein